MGTQLVEGAHLTGGDILCRESSKPFGFYDRGSEKTIPCRKLTWKTSLIGLLFFIVHTEFSPNLCNFVANLALLWLRAFWGHIFHNSNNSIQNYQGELAWTRTSSRARVISVKSQKDDWLSDKAMIGLGSDNIYILPILQSAGCRSIVDISSVQCLQCIIIGFGIYCKRILVTLWRVTTQQCMVVDELTQNCNCNVSNQNKSS